MKKKLTWLDIPLWIPALTAILITLCSCSKNEIAPVKPSYVGNWAAEDQVNNLILEFTISKSSTNYTSKITSINWKGSTWILSPSTDNSTLQYDSVGYLSIIHSSMVDLSIFFVGCKVDKEFTVINCSGYNYLYDNGILYFLSHPITINRKI